MYGVGQNLIRYKFLTKVGTQFLCLLTLINNDLG